jgi:hypothetical protein
MWSMVDGATSYILSILDDSGKLIYETVTTSLSAAFSTSGTALLDNKQYSWHVRAASDCTVSNESEDFFFTKVSGTTAVLPAPQWVNQSEDNKDPVVGGDQYVILQWRQINESNLYGYNIYRSTSPTKPTAPVETVLLDQLDAPPSNVNCPTFSTTSPGFCDVSVTNGTQYYYWIAAIDDGGSVSSLSVYQSVLLDLQRPVLIAPGSVTGTVVTTATPLMIWLPVNGDSVKYILSVTDTSTNSIIMQKDVSGTSTTYDGQTLKDQGVYTWNVKAYNNVVTSESSQTFKFTKGDSSTRPAAPKWCQGLAVNCTGNPGGPPYGYNVQLPNDTIKVYWQRITNANNIAGYYLYRSTSSADVFSATPIFVPDYDCEKTGQGCFSQAQMDRGEIYYFSITTLDTGGQESNFSEVLEVRYDLRAPVVLYPASDQTVYEPEPMFQWMHVNGATQYKVQVGENDSLAVSGLWWNAVMPANPTNGVASVRYGDQTYGTAAQPLWNHAFDPDSVGKTYYWRVCAINDITTTESACSNGFRFYKNLKAPVPKSPVSSQHVATDDVTFMWSSSPGAANYEFRVCEGGGNCDSSVIIYAGTVPGDQTSITLTPNDANFETCDTTVDVNCNSMGVYAWQVRAVDSQGQVSGRWDYVVPGSFVKVGMPSPNLIAPYDGSIIQPDQNAPLCTDMYGNLTYSYSIYFNWEEIANAGGYHIRVTDIKASLDANQPVIVYDGEVSHGVLDIGTCDQGSGEIPLAAGREYEWNVTTVNGGYFDNANARQFVTGLPGPNPRAPSDGKQVILSQDCDGASGKMCVHFEWDGGSFDDGAGNVTTLPGIIGASSYDIEIINQQQVVYHCERAYDVPAIPPAQSFKNLVTTFCDLSTEDVFNNDTFTWRVRARDSSNVLTDSGYGYPSAWSQNRQITVLIPGPILASPPPQSSSCYQDSSVDGVESECTTMSCQNPRFYWSPIPLSTDSCYRIEVSDTSDFRNLLRVANSVDNAADFVCDTGGCNSYKASTSSPIPMTNGVIYYWRVGASVPPDAAAPCGSTWIYSDTRAFLKRPNGSLGLSYSGVTYQGASFAWTPPRNCQNDGGEALSSPAVPPVGGEFITYLEQGSAIPSVFGPPYAHVPATQYSFDIPEGLSEQTSYIFCVAVVDDAYYFTDGGHHGVRECVMFTTAAAPEEGGG